MIIEITKDIKDPRGGRSKILKKGTVITCTAEAAKVFFDTKAAREYQEPVRPKKAVLNADIAEEIAQERLEADKEKSKK